MIHDDPNDPETTFNVGDLVRPIGAPGATPKPVQRTITTYEDEFDQPLERTDYIVNGSRFLEQELRLIHPAGGALIDDEETCPVNAKGRGEGGSQIPTARAND